MSGAVEGVALLPCPFCGGEATAYEGRYTSSVKCDNSHAMHEYKPTLAEAITAWNTRTTPPARSYADGEVDTSAYRTDYQIGKADGIEEAAKVAETYTPKYSPPPIGARENIAAAIRLLSQELRT